MFKFRSARICTNFAQLFQKFKNARNLLSQSIKHLQDGTLLDTARRVRLHDPVFVDLHLEEVHLYQFWVYLADAALQICLVVAPGRHDILWRKEIPRAERRLAVFQKRRKEVLAIVGALVLYKSSQDAVVRYTFQVHVRDDKLEQLSQVEPH